MKSKFISLLTAASIVFGLLTAPIFAAPSDVPFEERSFTVDTVSVDAAINALTADMKKSGNYDKVFEDYKTLIDMSADIQDICQMTFAEISKLDYGIESNYTKVELDENYDEAMEYGKKIDLAIKSILDSTYAKSFREYWGEERTALVESISEEIDNSYKEFSDSYYALLENNADGAEFAALLKKIIAYYGGDKLNEPADEYTQKVWDYCQNIGDYYYYVNKFKNYGTHNGLGEINGEIEVENPLKALSFVGKIDDRLKTAYEYLVRNNLCFYDDSGENWVGLTYPMSANDDAEILAAGDKTVIGTLIHEFGHFQTYFENDADNEAEYFGGGNSSMAEFNSQMFELIALDYYDEIYGENADIAKFNTLVNSLQLIANAANMTLYEMSLYTPNTLKTSDAELDEYLTGVFGENWYEPCKFYFTLPHGYLQYSLTMFDAVQVYNMYLKDKQAGLDKYFEACSYTDGTYEEITESLGLVSAFDENAVEYLENITDDIFKTLYDMDYETALDYFENGTYLGKVFPTTQRVSVNGGEPQPLMAYNSNDYNYIRIRDLAALLSGTSAQFDVEYDAQTYTINMLTDKPYGGEAFEQLPEVETAGQKAADTYLLLRDGERVGYNGAVFVNGWNCFMLRGLAEGGAVDMEIGYDEENDIVTITTK